MKHRIFVVGTPRSGTTLVQSLLAAHHEVTSFPESHFFSRHFKYVPLLHGPLLRLSPVKRLQAFLSEAGVDAELTNFYVSRVDGMLLPGVLRSLRTRVVARELLTILDETAMAKNKRIWIEKTPMHLHYLRFLDSLFCEPDKPQFVHVIRNGKDVVSSLHAASKYWDTAYDVDTCIDRWNRDVETSLGYLGHPRHHFMIYEELVSSPAAVIKRLFAKLDLDWDEEILERYATVSQALVTDQEVWKNNNAKKIEHTQKSPHRLTKLQHRRVVERLNTVLYEHVCRGVGYVPVSNGIE